MDGTRRLAIPLATSLALHSLLALAFIVTGLGAARNAMPPLEVEFLSPQELAAATAPQRPQASAPAPPPPAPPQPAEAAKEAPPPLPREQIVDATQPEALPPENTRFLAERNQRAVEETKAYGQPAPGGAPKGEATEAKPEPPREVAEAKARGRAAPPKAVPEPAEALTDPKPALPGLSSLFSKPHEILEETGSAERAEPSRERPPAAERSGAELAGLDRPDLWLSPKRGTFDYLPDVRDGRFTLLNAKADLFAPFVRRVGLRVFQTFSADFKRRILDGQVASGGEQIEVEAIMSADGRKLEVRLTSRRGNLSSDRPMLQALRDNVFFDENPPAGATADDGRIHFVFQLDASVWVQSDPRSGRRSPAARWVFGAGLL